jgi:dihydroorotate dehydrogenase (fumarate)
MPNLSVSYLGLELKNPVIAGSCGMTNSIENLKKIEDAGAGAVVLKSIFEEEIYFEFAEEFNKLGPMDNNLEFLDYYDYEIRKGNLVRYLDLIQEAKKELSIPVIASINCITAQEWAFFAKKIEDAGADAIEINMFILPSNLSQTSQDNESLYFDIISRLSSKVKIPLSLKISPYFSNLGGMIRDLSFSEIKGLVLFNKFYSPDIDIDKMTLDSSNVFSHKDDYTLPLRWIGMMSNRANCDLAASTGIHDWQAVVKLLLAGANVVQIVSAMYIHGIPIFSRITEQISEWMTKKNYNDIKDFRGAVSLENTSNPANYERVQYMRYFGDHE